MSNMMKNPTRRQRVDDDLAIKSCDSNDNDGHNDMEFSKDIMSVGFYLDSKNLLDGHLELYCLQRILAIFCIFSQSAFVFMMIWNLKIDWIYYFSGRQKGHIEDEEYFRGMKSTNCYEDVGDIITDKLEYVNGG